MLYKKQCPRISDAAKCPAKVSIMGPCDQKVFISSLATYSPRGNGTSCPGRLQPGSFCTLSVLFSKHIEELMIGFM